MYVWVWRKIEESNPRVLPRPAVQTQLPTIQRYLPNILLGHDKSTALLSFGPQPNALTIELTVT